MGCSLEGYRSTIGLFVGVLIKLLTRNAKKAAAKVRGLRVTSFSARLAVSCLLSLLLIGCVEANPGPSTPPNNTDRNAEQHSADSSASRSQTEASRPTSELSACPPAAAASLDTSSHTDVEQTMGVKILEAIRQQNEQFQTLQTSLSTMREDLGSIKTDISHVRSKCDELDKKCERLEVSSGEMKSAVQANKSDIVELLSTQQTNKQDSTKMSATVESLQTEMKALKSEVDRLEQFSRRDNLRMYGVPHSGNAEFENYDTCAKAVTDILNSADGPKQWTTDDIARAHRVGQSLNGKPKPMIVKFNRWKDKMAILSDRKFRDSLERRGVKVVSDLTRQQAEVVAAAKRDGKVAFFKRGKLTVEPRRPDPRSYAEVAAADDTEGARDRGRPADHDNRDNNARGQTQRKHGNGDGDSPRGNNWGRGSDTPARENRNSAHGGARPRQTGLHSHWGNSSRSPHNSVHQGNSDNVQPRRSERNKSK